MHFVRLSDPIFCFSTFRDHKKSDHLLTSKVSTWKHRSQPHNRQTTFDTANTQSLRCKCEIVSFNCLRVSLTISNEWPFRCNRRTFCSRPAPTGLGHRCERANQLENNLYILRYLLPAAQSRLSYTLELSQCFVHLLISLINFSFPSSPFPYDCPASCTNFTGAVCQPPGRWVAEATDWLPKGKTRTEKNQWTWNRGSEGRDKKLDDCK